MPAEPFSDNDIMTRVKSGEYRKLAILFERYKKPLFSYFYRNLGSQDISEDLVQNVFFRILKYRKGFKGYGKFTSWMYRIARNEMIDHFQKNNRYQWTETQNVPITQEQTPHEQCIHNEKITLLKQALGELSPEDRDIIILQKYQELKYKEIGDILGCAEGTVKARVFRAIHKLKAIIDQYEGE